VDSNLKGHVYYDYLQTDGAALFTVVCLPQKEGTFPTVITRSPYVDDTQDLPEAEICAACVRGNAAWLENGYAVVSQHCRGRGKSTGDCIPYIFEREDGLFLQDWIRKQTFYNGELYLCGGSYTSSVHFVTAPFSSDIKGAVLEVQDSQRYNCNYRNGFYKTGLHGGWYVGMYKKKSIPEKNYHDRSYDLLPLSAFSKTVLGEPAADFDEILMHPDRNDPFWRTRYGGGEAFDAIRHARIPILLVTGFYDIYTGGIFDMWNTLDETTRAQSALAVHPYEHGGTGNAEPVRFENSVLREVFPQYAVRWMNSVRNGTEPPFCKGKVTYYKLFGNEWCRDGFDPPAKKKRIPLGTGEISYRYDPNDPAFFPGGLSANFGGNEWQDPPYLRQDIISLFTPQAEQDVFIKGKMRAKPKVKSDCEDTCFYIRLGLCKQEGYYGLRDDINQISNFCADYIPGAEIEMDFAFDEHAIVLQKGEKLRIDISSSAHPHYVRHTNQKGLFSMQETVKTAHNTVILDGSWLELPIEE